jgi:hypothetical protein
VLEAAYGDERAPDGLEQSLVPWLDSLMASFVPHLRQVAGAAETERTELGKPIYRLEWLDEVEKVSLEKLALEEQESCRKARGSNGQHGAGSEVAPVRVEDALHDNAHEVWKPDDWGWAVLRDRRRVTQEGWWQDVREIELEMEGAET